MLSAISLMPFMMRFQGPPRAEPLNHTPIPHVNNLPAKLIDGKMDDFKKTKSYIFHVRFNFGRSDDMKRFKEEYIQGKPPVPKPRHQRRKKRASLAVSSIDIKPRTGRRPWPVNSHAHRNRQTSYKEVN